MPFALVAFIVMHLANHVAWMLACLLLYKGYPEGSVQVVIQMLLDSVRSRVFNGELIERGAVIVGWR